MRARASLEPYVSRLWISPLSLAAAALLVLFLAYIFLFSPNFREAIPGGDFLQYHLAARMVREGMQDRLYDLALQDRFQHDPGRMSVPPDPKSVMFYVYPPFFVWYCLPFSYLPFKAGAMAWVTVMAASLIASLKVLLGTLERHRHGFGIALLAALVFTPTLMALMSCQTSPLSLLILSVTYALLRARREFTAGMVFALLAFKPQLTPVIALAMLCKGMWRFVLGGMLGGLVLVAASLAISPIAAADYLKLGPILSRWTEMPGMPLEGMSCWLGFWRLLLAGRPLGEIQAVATISSLVTLVPLVWTLRGPLEPDSGRFPLQFAALVLATILISPHLLAYDLTLPRPPILLGAGTQGARARDGARDRLWPHLTLAVYVTAVISRQVAAMTGFQPIVPLMFCYMIALALAVHDLPSAGAEPAQQES